MISNYYIIGCNTPDSSTEVTRGWILTHNASNNACHW